MKDSLLNIGIGLCVLAGCGSVALGVIYGLEWLLRDVPGETIATCFYCGFMSILLGAAAHEVGKNMRRHKVMRDKS